MSQEEYTRKQQLEEERENSQATSQKQNSGMRSNQRPSIKKFAKDISSSISLAGLIEIRDIFFMLAIMMAILKDILDPTFLGPFMTPLVFFVTGAAMIICGSKNFFGKRKVATLLFGNLFEMIPGLDILPVETVITIIIYVFILQERKESREQQAQISASMSEEYA